MKIKIGDYPFTALSILGIVIIAFFVFFRPLSRIPPGNLANLALPAEESLSSPALLRGKVCNLPVSAKVGWRFWLKAELYNHQPARGKIEVFYYPDDLPDELVPGERFEFRGYLRLPQTADNPGSFDYRRYLSTNGIFAVFYVRQAGQWRRLEPAGRFSFWSMAAKLRTHLLRIFTDYFPSEQSAIMSGIILGEKGGLSRELQDRLIRIGVYHLLVASGSNVGMVLLIFWGIGRLLTGRNRVGLVLSLPFIGLYTLGAGAQPPVVRAGLMALFFTITYLFRREINPLHSLIQAAFLLLLLEPRVLSNIGFQLSFIATAGIVLFYPYGEKFRGYFRAFPWVGSILWVSFSAQLMLLPVLLYYFKSFPVHALMANLLITPLTVCLLFFGIGLTLTSFLCETGLGFLFKGIITVTKIFLEIFIWLVDRLDTLPVGQWVFPLNSLGEVVWLYLIILGFFLLRFIRPRYCRWIYGGASMLVILYLFYFRVVSANIGRPLKVTFLSAGTGEAVVLQMPDGKTLLLDGGTLNQGGEDFARNVLLPFFRTQGIRRLETVFLSHLHYPHYNALLPLMRVIAVKEFIYSPGKSLEPLYQDLFIFLRRKGIPLRVLKNGEVTRWGEVSLHNLGSLLANENKEIFKRTSAARQRQIDASSLVLLLSYGEVRFLFSSDVPLGYLRRFLKELSQKDGWEVPNHGNCCLSPDLPLSGEGKFAIISGKGMSCRGDDKLLTIPVFATGREGALTLVSEGKEWQVWKFRGKPARVL